MFLNILRTAGVLFIGALFFFVEVTLKPFFTYEKQIEKLKNDGLTINDEQEVIEVLKYEGYFNIINGYSCIFKNNKKYIKGTTFNNILSLYNFDKNLQSIVYKYALIVECHIKALIAHEFSKNYGVDEKQYLNESCFTSQKGKQKQIIDLIELCNDTIKEGIQPNNYRYRKYIEHSYNEHGHVPLWILIRALTFGNISIFYSLMKPSDKKAIADNYNINENQLSNMLKILVKYRNIVAHGERIYCAKLDKLRLNNSLSVINKMSIPKNDAGFPKYGRKDFLALIIIFKYLLPKLKFAGFMHEIENEISILSNTINSKALKRIKLEMGLSGSWKVLHKIKI